MIRRDTIAAVATGAGRAGIGIVRVSGPAAASVAQGLLGRVPEPRHATHAVFRDAAGAALDRGLALLFRAPQSYTGEDVLELHGHGGAVVLGLVLERCLELGARPAAPGEFTQRAFLNGKLDLVQAESVIDLIDASTTEGARGAMRSLEGVFSEKVRHLATDLVELRARLEATLDFPEEDIDALDRADTQRRLAQIRQALAAVLDAARQGSLLREGMRVALAGAPNVGKSSLLNRLAGHERAIVTPIPGTTRDTIRETIDLDGIPIHVIDTAGLRAATDAVESIGIQRARDAIAEADVVIHMWAAGEPGEDSTELFSTSGRRLRVVNKIDRSGESARIAADAEGTTIWLSAKTGAGIPLLRQALKDAAGWSGGGEGVFIARERHLFALQRAQQHLTAAARRALPELIAEELRLAHQQLGSITGDVTADDLLGEIFQRFCIGK